MAEDNKSDVTFPDLLVQLTEGFSTHTKVATRFWMALALVSLLAIMPYYNSGQQTTANLPFGIGTVERSDFYPLATLLISILIIGFCSSNFQAIRARRLIQRAIDALEGNVVLPGEIHLQDVFDSIAHPSINRIAPIAQILQGRFQFYPESRNCSGGRKFVSAFYYVLLKTVTYLVMYVFPAYALISSFSLGGLFSCNARPWKIPAVFFWFMSAIALLVLFQLFISDILFLTRALKRICVREVE